MIEEFRKLIKAFPLNRRLSYSEIYELDQYKLYADIKRYCPKDRCPSKEEIEELGDKTVLSKENIIRLLSLGVDIDEIMDHSNADSLYQFLILKGGI